MADFQNKIDKVQAKSKIDFVQPLAKIQGYVKKHTPDDITVLFLADGNDTFNTENQANTSLTQLKDYLTKSEISYRFFTIGLSAKYDFALIGIIAQSDLDLGNFFYVDYNDEGRHPTLESSYRFTTATGRSYKDQIKDCLVKLFDLCIPGGPANAEIMFGDTNKRLYLNPPEANEKQKDGLKEEKEVNGPTIYLGNLILDSLPED